MDLFHTEDGEILSVNLAHPLVEQTRLVRDRIVARVANTLDVRGWEYVNYGFLPRASPWTATWTAGLNSSDQWRSEWVDCLVREGILHRELVPHRHNPDDLVPVIKLSDNTIHRLEEVEEVGEQGPGFLYSRVDPDLLDAMQRRIVVSVEQFTSFRGFLWCPLGSLHRRLRAHDPGMVFQQAIEGLLELQAVRVEEYENPQSDSAPRASP